MNILLTNDDGYQAKGINALYHSLKKQANVTIVAPLKNESGQAHAANLRSPVKPSSFEYGYYLDGTPVDCVYFGLNGLKEDFDLVISGINHGANLGDDRWYSGTISAAREAAFHDYPSIAISHCDRDLPHLEAYADFLAQEILKSKFLKAHLYSYNLPSTLSNHIVLTRPGRRKKLREFFQLKDNRECLWHWFEASGPGIIKEGNDFQAIEDNKVALSIFDYTCDHENILDYIPS